MKLLYNTLQILYPILVVGINVSCSPTSTVTPTIQSPPIPKPTTALEQGTEFQVGQCDIPEDEYLFLKYSSHMTCTRACNCPEIEPPKPAIDREGDDIYYDNDQVIGSFEPWNPSDPAIGLLIDGWFEDKLYVIDKLSFEIPGPRIFLLSCMANGTAVIEIGGEAYDLDPGQSWSSQSVQDDGGGCYRTHTLTLLNYGLIEKWNFKSDLGVDDDFIRLEVKDRYFSTDEDITFDIIVIGEQNIDLSSFCSATFEKMEGNTWVEVGSCSAISNYAPEPYPREPGDLIEMKMPHSTLSLKYDYQYELSPGVYRIRITYYQPEGYNELYSTEFRITQ